MRVTIGTRGLLICVSCVLIFTFLLYYNVQSSQIKLHTLLSHISSLREGELSLQQRLGGANQQVEDLTTSVSMLKSKLEGCTTGSSIRSQGFVTFVELDRGDPNRYLPLLDILLQSIDEFSTRQTIVFGAGQSNTPQAATLANVTGKYRRTKLKFIDAAPINLFFSKLKAVLTSGLECGIYVDTDAVVNYRVDDLFEKTCPEAESRTYPLFVAHHNDPRNQGWTAPKSQPYGWAASFMWASSSLPFLATVYEKTVQDKFDFGNFDETALSVHAWELGVKEQACTFLTYPRAGELEKWYSEQNWPEDARYTVHDLIALHISSGGKNPQKSMALLEFYRAQAAMGKKVYYNQKTHKWLDSSEVGP